MATIPQLQLFSWKDLDCLGDLERLQLVQVTLPDEQCMGRGRDVNYLTLPLIMWSST